MNCPAKTEPILPDGHNQNPNALCSDLTTRSDLGRVANARLQREHRLSDPQEAVDAEIIAQPPSAVVHEKTRLETGGGAGSQNGRKKDESGMDENVQDNASIDPDPRSPAWKRLVFNALRVLRTYIKFVGPGFMVAVVYFIFSSRYHIHLMLTSLFRHILTPETMQQTLRLERATDSSCYS